MRIESANQPDGWEEPKEVTPADFVLSPQDKIPEPLRWITPQLLAELYRLVQEKGARGSRGGKLKIIIFEDVKGAEQGKTLEFVIGTERWPEQRSMLVTGYMFGKRVFDHQRLDLQNEQRDAIFWDPTVTEADIRKILGKS